MFASPISIYSVGEKAAAIFKVYSTPAASEKVNNFSMFLPAYIQLTLSIFFYEIHTVPNTDFLFLLNFPSNPLNL